MEISSINVRVKSVHTIQYTIKYDFCEVFAMVITFTIAIVCQQYSHLVQNCDPKQRQKSKFYTEIRQVFLQVSG